MALEQAAAQVHDEARAMREQQAFREHVDRNAETDDRKLSTDDKSSIGAAHTDLAKRIEDLSLHITLLEEKLSSVLRYDYATELPERLSEVGISPLRTQVVDFAWTINNLTIRLVNLRDRIDL